jgi:hypothetical protein
MDPTASDHPAGWRACRDSEYGFTLRHPPDWIPTGPPGRCVQFQRGEPSLPDGVPEVDVFIRVLALEAEFPADYLRTEGESGEQELEVGRGVAYSDRSELVVNGLPGIRARFRSAGPTPNWGVEYAIRKGDRILDAYVSRPNQDVEAEFDRVIRTLEW